MIISLRDLAFIKLKLNQGNLEAFKSSFARKDNLDAATDAGVRVHSLLNVPMLFSVLIGIAAMIIYQVTVL